MNTSESESKQNLRFQSPENSNDEEIITAFAKRNRLRACRYADGTTIIRGQAGCHLYEYDEGELGLLVLSEGQIPRPRRWIAIRKKCLEAGMTLCQNGERRRSPVV